MTTTKGKILRGDQRMWDGLNLTGSRRDSTGATISGPKVGNAVDVLMVYGEGENYTGSTIQKAVTAIGSKVATLVFAPGTWEITANLTVPANMPCRVPAGVTFNVASGVTLTFSGPVIQDYATWTSGSGTVTTNGNVIINGGITLNGTALTATAAELNALDGITSTVAELNILDGVTSTAAELNILDGVTSTAAELNELDASAAAVTNYVSGIRHYVYAGSSELTIDAAAVLSDGTFESFGPTGSGATNIWTAMDSMPSGCTAVIISVFDRVTASATSTQTVGLTGARQTGSSSTLTTEYITYIEFYSTTAVATEAQTDFQRDVVIPVDSSNRFDFRFFNSGNVGNREVDLYFRGFVI